MLNRKAFQNVLEYPWSREQYRHVVIPRIEIRFRKVNEKSGVAMFTVNLKLHLRIGLQITSKI